MCQTADAAAFQNIHTVFLQNTPQFLHIVGLKLRNGCQRIRIIVVGFAEKSDYLAIRG